MPDVRDINVLLQAMQEIGADVDRTGKHEVTISGKGIHPECDVDNEFIRKNQSFLLFDRCFTW